MAAIDVGSAAIGRLTYWSAYAATLIDIANAANDTGKLTSFELWYYSNATGVKAGTFYGSGTSYTSRDVESIGNVTAGSKQTFSGLDCDVTSGDFVGVYADNNFDEIEADTTGGSGVYYKAGDQFGAGTQTYTLWGAAFAISIYGIGATQVTSYTKTYTADALFKKLGLTTTYTADTLLKKTGILETVDADALIKKLGITRPFLAKAIFGAANISEITADVLLKALGLTQTVDVDALLQQQDITRDITADAIINLIATQSVDADAILKAIKTATFTVDVRLGEAGAVAFTASVYFKRLAFHVILDAQYITETPEVNRAYVIGRDAEGNPVHGTDLEQAEIDLVGERLDFQQHLSIPSSSLAADVADAMLNKHRLSKHRGFILIPPNAGAELWDVIQVTDTPCAQSGSKYRVLAITFDYHPRQHRYEHKLFLGAR